MSPLEFNPLALTHFRRQYESCASYAKYCAFKGVDPSQVKDWRQIPAIPTDCFKKTGLSLKSGDWDSTHTFHTSGTTGRATGKHPFPDLERYRRSVIDGFPQALLDAGVGTPALPAVFLDVPAEQKPHSSLTAMMGILHNHFESAHWLRDSSGEFDLSILNGARSPLFLFGTATAFLELFPLLQAPLPSGSFAMETGGYKATGVDLDKTDFYGLFQKHIGISPDSIWNEYSMTELSSQFYTCGLGGEHTAPAWARALIIDPESGSEAAPGEIGYLQIVDLANEHSQIAIRTQDFARRPDDGDHTRFTLIGRDPEALPRGCSRATAL